MELFEASLLAAPAGLLIAVAGSVWTRHLAPIAAAVLGAILGGVIGRIAWELFADPPLGFDFGSEFEGYDWVAGVAALGVLGGAILGTWSARRRRTRRALPERRA